MYLKADTIGQLWFELLQQLYTLGHPVAPRGQACREFTGVTLRLTSALNNVFVSDIRRLSYRFMVAEWLYIWFGHHDVATIAVYNPYIAQFSDNGIDFDGAYGPPVRGQWDYILETMRRDPDSRQAVLPIYKIPSRPTKDVPCTISLQFLLRQNSLEIIANMRSSDIWLGLPYDVFNFTMLGNILSAQLNCKLGGLTLHLGSSHLYAVNNETAAAVLTSKNVEYFHSPQLIREPPTWLDDVLTTRDPWFDPNLKPWDSYSQVLLADSNLSAQKILRKMQ
jgi:thymidylate synthase